MFWQKPKPTQENTQLKSAEVCIAPHASPRTFLNAKVAGAGEDGPVLAMRNENNTGIALGVFDGLGGSGARVVKTDSGDEVTSAAYASRLASWVVERTLMTYGFNTNPPPESFIPARPPEIVEPDILRAELHSRLLTEFKHHAEKLSTSQQAVRGTLSKRLPTTACILIGTQLNGLNHRLVLIWAGDSRAYLWKPSIGLVQLTNDHTKKETDALSAILDDTPMSNLVTPDLNFFLDLTVISEAPPFLAFVATDGVFQYFSSPMEFEEVLVRSIVESENWDVAISKFETRVQQVTNDDTSLAIYGTGWHSWDELRACASDRLSCHLNPLLAPLKNANSQLQTAEATYRTAKDQLDTQKEAVRSLRIAAWQSYRRNYELVQNLQAKAKVVP